MPSIPFITVTCKVKKISFVLVQQFQGLKTIPLFCFSLFHLFVSCQMLIENDGQICPQLQTNETTFNTLDLRIVESRESRQRREETQQNSSIRDEGPRNRGEV